MSQKTELRKPYPLINLNKKFILFTNAKCGGTTLKNWFVDTLDLENTFSGFLVAKKNYGFSFIYKWYKQFFYMHNIDKIKYNNSLLRRFIRVYREQNLNNIETYLNDPTFFKFAIIRDPFDRLVSGFVDKFCGKDLKLEWTQKVLKEVNSKDENFEYQITFSQFVEYLLNNDLSTVDSHWRHQTYVLDQVKLNRVILLKNMSKELPKINAELGIELKLNLNKKRQSNIYGIDLYKDHDHVYDIPNTKLIQLKNDLGAFPNKSVFYNDELKAKVRIIYKADFEFFDSLNF